MIIVSKTKSISLEIQVATNAAHRQQIRIEINDTEVTFRSRGMMTSCDIKSAKTNPSRLMNALSALVSDIYDYELDEVGRELIKYL